MIWSSSILKAGDEISGPVRAKTCWRTGGCISRSDVLATEILKKTGMVKLCDANEAGARLESL